ncbi:MAG: XRE family transcriptional regulator [Campylobacteraceae bacterium]|nr:XRE family transcriptional regulator [Campylobacteraceae bacterium]
MNFGKTLKKLRVESGYTQEEVAKHLGFTRSNIAQYESGSYDPSIDTLRKLAKLFKVDIGILSAVLPKKLVRKIQIIGMASCGKDITNTYQDDNEFAYYSGNYWTKNLYCVIASGDSMYPEIEDGDEVICDPDAKVQNGDMVHYTIGNENAIKVYYKEDEAYIIQLVPFNQSDEFKTRTIKLDDEIANKLKVVKVVSVNRLNFSNCKARLKMIGKI